MNITGRKDILQQWLEELRSGEYIQAFGRERTFDEKYCALGILNNVLEKNSFGRWTKISYGRDYPFYFFKDSYDGRLNDAFLAWRLDLTASDVIQMNDDRRFSLKQIADEIEARKIEPCRA